MIRIGIDTETVGYCAPVFIEDDYHFEYIPIPEGRESNETRTYSNTFVRNRKYATYMSDFLDEDITWKFDDGSACSTKNLKIHFDPEFETNTYGDYWIGRSKGRIPERLRSVVEREPAYLFFYSGLSPYDTEVY